MKFHASVPIFLTNDFKIKQLQPVDFVHAKITHFLGLPYSVDQ